MVRAPWLSRGARHDTAAPALTYGPPRAPVAPNTWPVE